MIARLKQRETFAVVEFTVEKDGIDAEDKAVKQTKEPSEDAAGGVAVSSTVIR